MTIQYEKLHILVVEDLAPMQDIIHEVLKMLGVGRITMASNTKKAFDLYINSKPDIIITDWDLPDSDGISLIKKIRRSKYSPNRSIPIIMLTGFSGMGRIAEARDAGVTEFQVKPFQADDISKKLVHVIKHPRDFIVTPNFVGPDRRRRADPNFKDEDRRKEKADRRIKAKNDLESKTGTGEFPQSLVERSQRALEESSVDFIPLAEEFLADLRSQVLRLKMKKETTRRDLEHIIYPIMQLKANAKIFKYPLIGELAGITLDFLENLAHSDEFVIQIMDANLSTFSHVIGKRIKEADEDASCSSLEQELSSAYARYMNVRAGQHKQKLKQTAR